MMTSSLPERIAVGPITYRVTVDAHDETDNQRTLGETDLPAQRIGLCADQGPDQMRETLWHEVIHVVLECLGIRHTEQMVVCTAMLTLDTLRRNPELATYLLARDDD